MSDFDADKIARTFRAVIEQHQLIGARPTRENFFVGLTCALDKHLDDRIDQRGIFRKADVVLHAHEFIKAAMFSFVVNLIREGCGGRPTAFRVNKSKCRVELNRPQKVQRLLKIFVGLAGKACD